MLVAARWRLAARTPAWQAPGAVPLSNPCLAPAGCREEGEKFNVWVAYLNMENLYGSEDASLALLSRALAHTDARRMYLAAVDIFERTHKEGLVEQCLKAMTRKFSDSAEVGRRRLLPLPLPLLRRC